MVDKVKDFLHSFESNNLRRLISFVNWRYHRADLVERLQKITDAYNKKERLIGVYAKSGKNALSIEGNDSIFLRFMFQHTNITYHHNDGSKKYDYETGATLHFAHSDAGYDTVFLYPATSKQSGADFKKLIIYHNQCGAKFQDYTLKKLIKKLCLYHRYTSVLFEVTPLLRFQIALLRLESFRYQYLKSEEKFKFSSGIYIPLASFFVSLVALVVAVIALK